jgi:hypothetical protein
MPVRRACPTGLFIEFIDLGGFLRTNKINPGNFSLLLLIYVPISIRKKLVP